MEALQRARSEGLIGHIGITSHSLDVLDQALDDGLFDTIMVCFSFLEPLAREKIIPKAAGKDIGVTATSNTSTMLGWFMSAEMRASAKNMLTTSGCSSQRVCSTLRTRSFLNLPMASWRAKKISAMPPVARC